MGIPRIVTASFSRGHFIFKLFLILNIWVHGFSEGVPFMYVCDLKCKIKAKKQMCLNQLKKSTDRTLFRLIHETLQNMHKKE